MSRYEAMGYESGDSLFAYTRYVDPLTGLAIDNLFSTKAEMLLRGINDPTILRMLHVGMLGLSREAPMVNEETRGQHSIAVGLAAYTILERNGFSRQDCILGFIEGLMHDPHPAGGDATKRAFDIDEKSVAADYYFSGEADERFMQWFADLGLDPILTKQKVLAMIRREANDPVSQLVHTVSKARGDLDWMLYTTSNLAFASKLRLMSSRDMSTDCHGPSDSCEVLNKIVETTYLQDEMAQVNEYNFVGSIPTVIFRYEDFNALPHVRWVPDSGWVFTNDEIYAHLVVASAALHRSQYFNPSVQGPEYMYLRELRHLQQRDDIRSQIMRMDDDMLVSRLSNEKAGFWLQPEAHIGWRYRADDGEALSPGEFRITLPTFELRTQTLVRKDGVILPFAEARPEIVSLANDIIATRSGRPMILVYDRWHELSPAMQENLR